MTATRDDRAVAAAALVGLARMNPYRLRRLFAVWPDPRDVVRAVRTELAVDALREQGRRDPTDLVRGWSVRIDLDGTERLLEAHETHVRITGDDDYPIDTGIEDHPAVLLAEGRRPDALDRPRVAVVGTRAATPHGLADAYELGSVLARAGVTVVSGLAIGIDGAAHEGALDAGGAVVGVLGTGLDVVYPRRHTVLHHRVREHGLLVSEYCHGTQPHPSRFPARNRIIAGLADVVVVVEATATGGARITADRATDYGRELCVYPGSRRNPSARGSNEMLRAAHVVVDPDDVLGVLGLTEGERRTPPDAPTGTTVEERTVLAALGGEPATVDEITSRCRLDPGPVAVAVAGLVRAGLVRRAHGLLWPT
ncbi:MAG: DNA-processing protein DprA [Acidimicrobiia bacterium]